MRVRPAQPIGQQSVQEPPEHSVGANSMFRGRIDGPLRFCERCSQPLRVGATHCPSCGTPAPPSQHSSFNAASRQMGGMAWLVLIAVGTIVGTLAFLWPCGVSPTGAPTGNPSCSETQAVCELGLVVILAGFLLALFGRSSRRARSQDADAGRTGKQET